MRYIATLVAVAAPIFLAAHATAVPARVPIVNVAFMRPLEAGNYLERRLAPVQTRAIAETPDGSLVVGLHNGLLRIDRWDGEDLARLDVEGEVSSCVAVSGAVVLACTTEGKVVSWDGVHVEPDWQVTLDEPLGVRIDQEAGCILVASRLGSVWCLNPADGSTLWKYGVAQLSREMRHPVVRWVSMGTGVLFVWRENGEASWLRISEDGYTVLARTELGVEGLYVTGDPVVLSTNTVYLPTNVSPGLQLTFTGTSIEQNHAPGDVRKLSTWPMTSRPVFMTSSGAVVHLPAAGQPVVDNTGRTEASVLLVDMDASLTVFDGASAAESFRGPHIRMDKRGQFYDKNGRIPSPHIVGLASNILVGPGLRRDQANLWYVSAAGWLYRITVPLQR